MNFSFVVSTQHSHNFSSPQNEGIRLPRPFSKNLGTFSLSAFAWPATFFSSSGSTPTALRLAFLSLSLFLPLHLYVLLEQSSTKSVAKMSEVDMVVDSATSTAVEGGERQLTNKEKRQLAVAQKRAAKEKAAAAPTAAAVAGGTKRKHDGEATAEGEADGEGEEEVEVVSHKEQRRRKKLAKLSDPSSSSTSAEGTDSANPNALMHPSRTALGAPAQIPRSGFSVWVGNLSFFTAPAKLMDWFQQRGIEGISRVNMPKGARRAEMNKGFAT